MCTHHIVPAFAFPNRVHLVRSLEVEAIIGASHILVPLPPLGKDDGLLKQEHPSSMPRPLHKGEVTLSKDLALLYDVPLRVRGEGGERERG